MQNNFRMAPAYSGGLVVFSYWGRTVFDVSGLRYSSPLPALREHQRDRNVGIVSQISVQGQALHAEGRFLESTQDGREVMALAGEGFPWQASVAIWPEEVEEVLAGQAVTVNGFAFKGPGIVVRKGHLREISFVALGLDSNTSALPMAAAAGGGLEDRGDPASFMEAIKLQMSAGLPVRLAISAAARQHPGLYSGYLSEIEKTNEEYLNMEYPASAFERKVELFMHAGLSRGQATKKAVREFPELHEAYLAQVNSEEIPAQPAPKETFEGKVRELMAGGLGRSQAIKQVAHDFPALHENYLDRVNS